MQCTDATWRAALERMLRDTDVVVMDLGGFSQSNRGCVYELGQIIEHIPLQRVMLVVDEDTDTACLVEVLGQAWSSMSEASPNSGAAPRIRAVQLRAEPAGFIEEPGSARLATSVLPADKTRFAGVLLDLAGGASATLSFTNYHWTRSGLPGPLSSL
jgi:hypothetical protein